MSGIILRLPREGVTARRRVSATPERIVPERVVHHELYPDETIPARPWDRERDGPPPLLAVPLSSLDRTPPAPLLLDRLDPHESTILFGPGDIGKGTLACSWIAQLVASDLRVLVLDYEDHGGEWARRIAGLAGDDALGAVLWAAPLADGLGPIWTHADTIRAFIVAQDVDYIVIDSAVYACSGADPSKAEVAILYGAALQVIATPSLTLAHVTKLHDPRYPFGSAFWHNSARVSWSMMPKGDDVLLACRKSNNYRKPSAQVVTVTWHEDVLREVREKPAVWALEDRIAEVLADGPLSPVAIAAALNDGLDPSEQTPRSSIRNVLSRSLRRSGGRFTVDNAGLYCLRPGGD